MYGEGEGEDDNSTLYRRYTTAFRIFGLPPLVLCYLFEELIEVDRPYMREYQEPLQCTVLLLEY